MKNLFVIMSGFILCFYTEKKDYDRPSKPDDQFAMEFPMTGKFDIRMITLSHEYVAMENNLYDYLF